MAEDAGVGGFEVGSAYVRVDPDASTFPESLEEQLGELNYVVRVPVVPDAGDFAGEVDAAVAESGSVVTVPVVPDTGGFQLLIDDAVAQARDSVTIPVVPDAAGFPEAVDAAVAESDKAVTVPVVPDMAGFAETAEAEAAGAGEAAGVAFSEKLNAAASAAGVFPVAAAERDAEVAGEGAATGFGARFSALLSKIPLLGPMIPGVEAEAGEAGTLAGASFGGKLKAAVMGDISPMELLMGAGFAAATAVMATKFQAAMELIHTQAGVGQGAIAGLSSGVLNLAGKVGESPDSLAAALYHIESSFQSVGISGQSAMALLQTAAEGAMTGNANLVDVTNALDATIVSGVGGISSYSQAMGALNAIVGTGDMTMQDLADAMGTGLMAAGKAYGQSIYEIGAALATLGDNNIRGAKAATDIRMAWQAVEKPLATATGTLTQLGLTQTSLADEMTHHGLTAALQMFVTHLKDSHVPIDQWGQYVTEIFGKRAGVGIQVLMDQLDRLKGKLPDIEKGAHGFASAWDATKATTKQALKDLESGFEALMIKIGDGLLPAVNGFLHMVVRDLPEIEHLGEKIAHLAAPFVTLFFTGLHDILKVLFGPLKEVTGIVIGLGVALGAISAVNPWLALIAGLIVLVGAIVKYHKQIVKVIEDAWGHVREFFKKFWPEILAGATLAFGPIVPLVAGLAVLIIKYHKQIWDAIKETWDKVKDFFEDIAKDIIKAFDDIKKAIVTGFDAWWKSHGAELEKVWKTAWDVMRTVFKAWWDWTLLVLKVSWDTLMAYLKPALDLLGILFKVTWDAIAAVFKDAWDVIAAVVKIAVSGIEATIKIAWDIIVGVFSIFLDLITGHWSKAWTDLQKMTQQVWNAIKSWLGSVWNDIYKLVVQVVNNLKGFLVTAWDDIKKGVASAFDDVRHTIASIWDGILHDIEKVVDKIKSLIGDVTGPAGKILSSVGHALGDIGLAGGGVLAGYAPGHDTISARLSPGEAVLVPEAVRAIGPDRINAINAHYSAGRGGSYSGGGIAGSYAYGGISPYAAGAAAGQAASQAYGTEAQLSGQGINVYFQYYGTQQPTPEQQQAMMMKLAAAVGVS